MEAIIQLENQAENRLKWLAKNATLPVYKHAAQGILNARKFKSIVTPK